MEILLKYWWVNQDQTYNVEVPGGFLWSPRANSDGGRNHFYDNMTVVRPGDPVFSSAGSKIMAIGVAIVEAEAVERPEFGSVGEQWTKDGWLVRVDFTELDNPVRPKDFISELVPFLPAKYSPIRADGGGN